MINDYDHVLAEVDIVPEGGEEFDGVAQDGEVEPAAARVALPAPVHHCVHGRRIPGRAICSVSAVFAYTY